MKNIRLLTFVLTIASVLLSACGAAAPSPAAPQATVGAKPIAMPVAFVGIVDSIAGDQWIISGTTVTVDPTIVRDGPFNVGDRVKVEGFTQSDGSLTLSRVEAPTLQETADDNSNDAVNGNTNDANVNDDHGGSVNSNDDNSNTDNSNAANTNDDNGSVNSNEDNSNTTNTNDDNGGSSVNSNDDNSNTAGSNDNGNVNDDNSNTSNSNDDNGGSSNTNNNSNDDQSGSGGSNDNGGGGGDNGNGG